MSLRGRLRNYAVAEVLRVSGDDSGYPSPRSSIANAVRNHINPTLERLEIEEGAQVHYVTHSRLGGAA